MMTDIGEKFPYVQTKLSWIPGKDNPADLVSKFFESPLEIVNSGFYREDPSC